MVRGHIARGRRAAGPMLCNGLGRNWVPERWVNRATGARQGQKPRLCALSRVAAMLETTASRCVRAGRVALYRGPAPAHAKNYGPALCRGPDARCRGPKARHAENYGLALCRGPDARHAENYGLALCRGPD